MQDHFELLITCGFKFLDEKGTSLAVLITS